jgi:phospholipid/cholesterol/gamma-HCH transport system substrate-binding protein
MRKTARAKGRATAVAVVALLGLGGAAFGAVTAQGTPPEQLVYAEFADASPLITGNTVKVSGVKVGEVRSISVREGKALVAMRITEASVLPLYEDASARIRPVSLLGERYVDLDRGSPPAPVRPPDRPIPAGQTGSAVDLQDVLDMMDQPTGTALAAMVTTLGEGVHGEGQNIDAAIQALAPALHRTDQLVGILDEQNELLTSLIDRVDPVAGALAADGGANLDRLLDSADLLLRTTAANRTALDASLQQLPSTLTDARRTLAQVAGVAEATTPALESVRRSPTTSPRSASSCSGSPTPPTRRWRASSRYSPRPNGCSTRRRRWCARCDRPGPISAPWPPRRALSSNSCLTTSTAYWTSSGFGR